MNEEDKTTWHFCEFLHEGKKGFDGTPRCTNGGKCTEEDFCYGCKIYICENHSIGIPFGSHSPEDHLNWPED